MSAGVLVIVGLVSSFMVMICSLVDAFPQISVAVQVLVMLYLLAQIPGVIWSFTDTVTVPVQLSLVVIAVVVAAGTSVAQL